MPSRLLAAIAALLLFTIPAHAQDRYPTKPIRLVVPFAVGGATDIMARIMGQKMGEILGQIFVVDNRAGAGGNLGSDLVAKAPADGYTLLKDADGQTDGDHRDMGRIGAPEPQQQEARDAPDGHRPARAACRAAARECPFKRRTHLLDWRS